MITRTLFIASAILFLGFLLLPRTEQTTASAQPPKKKDEVPKTPPKKIEEAPLAEFECRWAEGPIVIDGKADEKAWAKAMVIDNFYMPWLGKNPRPPKTKTTAKLLWDREYIYFHADMEDTDLYADVKEQDGQTWDNDVFELFFKPSDKKPGYYEFQVNAAGTKMDMYIPRRTVGAYKRFAKDGDFHMDAKVILRGTLNKWDDKDQGWSVEGRIPWADFVKSGGRPAAEDKWTFALCRYDYCVDFDAPELSTCAPLVTKDFHAHENYAPIKFVGPPVVSKPFGLTSRVPLTTSTVVGSPEPPMPYKVERVYPKLPVNFPISIDLIPGSDRLLFIDQDKGNDTIIHMMKDDPEVKESEVVLKFKGTAYSIAYHPQFAKNGFVYVGWVGPGPDGKKHVKITRWTMGTAAPWKLDPDSEKLIIEWASDGHNGAAICFGLDGMMYITSGDGTSDSDTNVAGQRLDTLLSKVLRIDVDHPDKDKTYSVPLDNPFWKTKGARPETWAYGLRNPWRMHCDKKTGHIWVGNNGQDIWEQIYFVRKGDNYGWSVYEGGHPFYLTRQLGPTPHVKPALEHHHSEARSMTGGIVYYGSKFPDLVGHYIYGDYSTGRIWAAKHDGTKVVSHREIAQTRLQISGFGTDSKGEILICDHDKKDSGGIWTLVPTPKDLPPSKFPRTLSASGLFESVKGHKLQPAMIPYSVNSPLWSDGAYKERWLGMPGAESTIEYNKTRSWGFPEKTVIVKSFAIEMVEGKPETRKWIETRFLTKQEKEWYGYSYIWNDEQTEGTLVESKGIDREYTIKTASGERKQKWHYPSRSECMVCHSRAANWVLGLSEAQMNRDHPYASCTDNQLRSLEHIGLFKINYAQAPKDTLRMELEKRKLTEEQIKDELRRYASSKDEVDPVQHNRFYKMADPYDKKADLDQRARSYLHTNCAQCHVAAGGGNSLFDVAFSTAPDKMLLFNVKPVHHTFNIPDVRLVVPGSPERSVLLHRMSHREAGFMPPLATTNVDREAVELIREWIQKMPPRKEEPVVEKKKDVKDKK